MTRCCFFSFEQCLCLFTMLLVEGFSQAGLFRHLSNHVFHSPYVQKYISYEDHLFFWKCSKLNLTLENAKKNWENSFCFWDKCIWKCCNKLSLLRREYLSSAVNRLTNSPKILHITQTDFFNLNCFHSDQWVRQRYCRSDFNSVSVRLPCYLWQGRLTEEFLEIYLITFFGVRKFKNTSAMKVVFFLKMLKIESKFRKWKKKKKMEKNVFLFWDN